VCVCVHSEVGDESPVGCGDVATAADYWWSITYSHVCYWLSRNYRSSLYIHRALITSLPDRRVPWTTLFMKLHKSTTE